MRFREEPRCGRVERIDLLVPVLDAEALDSSELPGVVGYQREAETASMRSDEQIVCANHGSTHLEGGTYLGIVKSRLIGIF
jgi:hypothetical protein